MALAIIFDSVGFGEWFVLLAVVLVVVGPKRLPSAAKELGRWSARIRRAADEFRRQLMEMDDEVSKGVESAAGEADEFFRIEGDEASADPQEREFPDGH